MKPPPPAALKRLFESSNRHERAEAAIALVDYDAKSELPALRELAVGDDTLVGVAAMYACWRLGEGPISVDILMEALSSGDEELIQLAVHTVSAIGPPIVPVLQPFLKTEPRTAKLALRLLDEVGGPEALRVIRELSHPDIEVSELAEEILEDHLDEAI